MTEIERAAREIIDHARAGATAIGVVGRPQNMDDARHEVERIWPGKSTHSNARRTTILEANAGPISVYWHTVQGASESLRGRSYDAVVEVLPWLTADARAWARVYDVLPFVLGRRAAVRAAQAGS